MKNRRCWKLKYLIEWIIALFVTVLLLPLFIIIVILEKFEDGGSIFYISNRIGKNGKPFSLYKFRGMVMDAQPIITDELKFITIENDPRITKLGKILRLGFDELAQLINILKGEMCIIGPRPNLPWEINLYSSRDKKRLEVLPGITGLTQILDGRSLHIKDNYELDVRYVENSTFYTDILILLFTIPYSFGFKNFYRKYFKNYLEGVATSKHDKEISEKGKMPLTKNDVYL
jgi:lipopolysaccharide/colanic/teichoic acid biosynthesis glycosyltransferase